MFLTHPSPSQAYMRHMESRNHESVRYSFHAKGAAVLRFLRSDSKVRHGSSFVAIVLVWVISSICKLFVSYFLKVNYAVKMTANIVLMIITVGSSAAYPEEPASWLEGPHHEMSQVSV